MQKAEMRGVDVAFERLQPIAVTLSQGDVAVVRLGHGRLDIRQGRRRCALSHIDEHQAAALGGLVCGRLYARGISGLVRQVRLIEAIAVHVEFPAVISAANAVVLIAAQEQRGQTVRAQMIHDADAAAGIAERNQLLPEQHQAHLRSVGHELPRKDRLGSRTAE